MCGLFSFGTQRQKPHRLPWATPVTHDQAFKTLPLEGAPGVEVRAGTTQGLEYSNSKWMFNNYPCHRDLLANGRPRCWPGKDTLKHLYNYGVNIIFLLDVASGNLGQPSMTQDNGGEDFMVLVGAAAGFLCLCWIVSIVARLRTSKTKRCAVGLAMVVLYVQTFCSLESNHHSHFALLICGLLLLSAPWLSRKFGRIVHAIILLYVALQTIIKMKSLAEYLQTCLDILDNLL